MNLKLIIILLLVTLLTACAGNKRKPSDDKAIASLLPGGALLIGFNRNDDYEIDKAEFDQGRENAFKQADANGNGYISASEYNSWHPKAMGSITALPNRIFFDRNFNDSITKSEFDTGMEKLFSDADKDNDQRVSYGELVLIVAPPAGRSSKSGSGSRRGEGRSGGGGRGGGRGGGGGGGGRDF